MDLVLFLASHQTITLGILIVALVMFFKDKWRYDVVALAVLVTIIFFQILPLEEALAYFGHPAVIIVASMFIMGRAVVQSGIIDLVVRKLEFLHNRPIGALAVLVVMVTILSAFINDVGALAIVIPIALHLARKSKTPVSLYLLPIAFASHLGGFLTLIGTPRNIIISSFREEVTGVPFQLFDFAWVGFGVVIAGLLFLTMVAWRIVPRTISTHDEISADNIYTTEAEVTARSPVLGLTVAELAKSSPEGIKLFGVFRSGSSLDILREGYSFAEHDVLVLSGTSAALTQFTEERQLMLIGLRAQEKHVTSSDEFASIEAVVPPYSNVVGMAWDAIAFPRRFGTNFIGLSRNHTLPKRSLATIRLQAGDVVLLQGRTETVRATIASLNFLPLAERELTLGRTRNIVATLSIVVYAILVASISTLPIALVFLSAATLLLVFNLISLRQAYDSIDLPVLVLLAGMLALGSALTASGVANSLADALLGVSAVLNPISMLAIVLIVSMMMSDFMNTTASAVIMAPIAIILAEGIGASIDPFLIAVAIGASSAFLTPIGHESNTLVMEKGGYRFSDFMRVGLPLEIILIVVALPLIVIFWPLF